MNQGWHENIVDMYTDGPTLTAAAAASMIHAAAKKTVPGGYFSQLGKQLLLRATGRISCAVTTPGTARFDIRYGGTVIFDTLAMPLNIVAKTNVGWWLEVLLTLRAVGSTANFMGQGVWQSEAYIGSPAATAGGNGAVMVPYNAAPAVGNNFDATASQAIDFFFTQTVATGSLTCHQLQLVELN